MTKLKANINLPPNKVFYISLDFLFGATLQFIKKTAALNRSEVTQRQKIYGSLLGLRELLKKHFISDRNTSS